MIANIFSALIYSFIMTISMLIIWHKLLYRKIDFKDKKLYMFIIGIMATSSLNYLLVNKFVRVIVIMILFMIFFHFLFKETIQKTILVPIFYEIILLVSEFSSVIILTLFLGKFAENFIQTFYGILTVNILVAIISVLIVYIKFIRKIFNKILSITDKIDVTQLILFCLLFTICLNIFSMSAYYKVKFEYWVTANVVLIIIFIVIMIYYLNTKNNLNKVNDKYSVAIKSLNDYEMMMKRYRVANHENKNLLLTIRAMILNKEKDIPKFIDSVIEDKYEDDEKLLFKMTVIPSGGLRATIYSEIMKIRDKKINYELHIDKDIKTIDLIELDTNTIIDICKIIGVFIDNAIEEVQRLKTKNIGINIYLDEDVLNIKISNNYHKGFNIKNIGTKGYTTKGEGHGYGLSLVENIVKNNSLLKHNMELSKSIFSQIISIECKKSH